MQQLQKDDRQLPVLDKINPPARFTELGFSQQHWQVLTQQFYPEAKDPETILLAATYCKARNLDVMSKPLHIVSYKKRQADGSYKDVDTILPGVALYEITAHRTGEFTGKDPAQFGPVKRFTFVNENNRNEMVHVEAPEWATVTVWRTVKGVKCAFTSDPIYFLEFVGKAKGRNIGLPNDNWRNRPRMMMGKCALSAALRVAFPEEIGSEPTAEEFEGRVVTEDDDLPSAKLADDPATKAIARAGNKAKQTAPEPEAEIVEGEISEDPERLLSDEERTAVRNEAKALGYSMPALLRLMKESVEVTNPTSLTVAHRESLLAHMRANPLKAEG